MVIEVLGGLEGDCAENKRQNKGGRTCRGVELKSLTCESRVKRPSIDLYLNLLLCCYIPPMKHWSTGVVRVNESARANHAY